MHWEGPPPNLSAFIRYQIDVSRLHLLCFYRPNPDPYPPVNLPGPKVFAPIAVAASRGAMCLVYR